MMTPASQLAEYVLAFSHQHGDPVSNLKLQKLLYYVQAWHLALFDTPAFSERIEAWVHGPAVPPVYGQYKQWSWQPIQVEPPLPVLDPAMKDHVDEVMDTYGELSAYQLEKLTHEEEPWRKARKGLAPDVPSNNVISHDDMRAYYRARALEQQDQAR